jgi:chloride channel protein, CIC family
MFVPLFLTGGAFGKAFAMSVVHNPSVDLYAAVGMAAFIAGGYKTPLTAVVFVAEATGGHSYIIPTLIGAAVAYAVSGEASVSGDQHLREGPTAQPLREIPVREIMQEQVVAVPASATLREFAESVQRKHDHTVFPVLDGLRLLGTISLWSLVKIDSGQWTNFCVREYTDQDATQVLPECNLMEALRLLTSQKQQDMLLVVDPDGKLEGVVTKKDILKALNVRENNGLHAAGNSALGSIPSAREMLR